MTANTVSFTQMADGTAEDYELLDAIETEDMAGFPDRVLGWLHQMDDDTTGHQITRLEHLLQAATRAHRAAAVLRPYVSEQNYWIVKHHGVFQGYYYFHHRGADRNARDAWRDHPYYQATVDFCATTGTPPTRATTASRWSSSSRC